MFDQRTLFLFRSARDAVTLKLPLTTVLFFKIIERFFAPSKAEDLFLSSNVRDINGLLEKSLRKRENVHLSGKAI